MAHNSNSRSLTCSHAKFPRIPLRYTHRKPANLFSRTRNVAKLDTASTNADVFGKRDANASRRQSLPPICRNQTQSYNPHDKFDRELGGETSGYGSDNPNNTPEYLQVAWNQTLGYESSSSARDDRAKWGDRGVGVGKFWDPQCVKYSKIDDTPGWVKRGLSGETDLIVSNTSPAESPEQDYGDPRPYTSSSMSQTRTYIRGQNNPIDPVELAERERRRQLARAHQEAIKQQLEEREQRRNEERERRIREEREEELRIEREQEVERKRREHELHLLREKQEREKKRKEALQKAIQLAEKEAQEQKMKQKMGKLLNINENVVEKEKVVSPRIIGTIISNDEEEEAEESKNNLVKVQNDIKDIDKPINKSEKLSKPNNIPFITNLTTETKDSNIKRVSEPFAQTSQVELSPQQPPVSSRQYVQENVAMVLQAPFEGYPTMPFAILMPTFTSGPTNPLPLTVPVQVNNAPEVDPIPRTENRILTPTQYRNKRYCSSSTQTEFTASGSKSEQEQNKEMKYMREKFVNMDVNYDTRSRKDSRSRTSERLRDNPNERPKWGANRPPTRYMKQSEKDPFYQRKKTRQKMRQIKVYDDKNNNYSAHSSDDSQTVSPRNYRRKGYIEKRRTRALWQKNERVFARNVQVYQTEIVPLEADKDQIYYKKHECVKCCCDCRSEKHKYPDEVKVVDILKIEHTPRDEMEYKSNEEYLPECNNSSIDSEVLEKLNSLHTGLMLKQEQWQQSPRTPRMCSPRTTEINS